MIFELDFLIFNQADVTTWSKNQDKLLLKRDSNKVAFLWICEAFNNSFVTEHLW